MSAAPTAGDGPAAFAAPVDVGVEEDVQASGAEAEGRTSVPVEGGVAHRPKVVNSNAILTMGSPDATTAGERPALTVGAIAIKMKR